MMDMGSSSTSTAMMSSSTGMSSMSMMGMAMVFNANEATPLFSNQWTPSSTGSYAGTCIFLIILGIISRLLLAYRTTQEIKWHDRAANLRYIAMAGECPADQSEKQMDPYRLKGDTELTATLTIQGVVENVRVVRTAKSGLDIMPWRFGTDLPRACIFTVQAGVGYLLMLAVMTLNVGYFLSVLGGLFVGEVAVGRFAHLDGGHH